MAGEPVNLKIDQGNYVISRKMDQASEIYRITNMYGSQKGEERKTRPA
jgi:hypothetical protein